MKNHLLFFIILLFLGNFSKLYAQEERHIVSGTVTDASGQVLSFAQILVVTQKDSSLIAFTTADEKGAYQVSLPPGNYKFWLSYVGYDKLSQSFSIPQGAKPKLLLNFQMKGDPQKLQEIVIEEKVPIKIKEDTLEFDAATYRTEADRKLKDVLKKLPGVDVNEDGKVFVEGQEVQDVMIEGDELYEDNPQLITNTFSAQAVDKIQVLDDFQEPGQIARLNSNRKAINITLREDKKNVILGDIEAGGGVQERYKGETNLYWVSKKWKSTMLTNLNNVGEQVFSTMDYLRMSGALEDAMTSGGGRISINSNDLPLTLASSEMPPRVKNYLGSVSMIYNPNPKWKIRAYLLNSYESIFNDQAQTRTFASEDLAFPYRQGILSERKSFYADYAASVIHRPHEKHYWRYDIHLLPRVFRNESDVDLLFGDTNNIFEETDKQNQLRWQNRLRWKYTISETRSLALDIRGQQQFGSTRYNLGANRDPFASFFGAGSGDLSALLLQQRLREPKSELKADLNYSHRFNKQWAMQSRLGTSWTWETPQFSLNEELLPQFWSVSELDQSANYNFGRSYGEVIMGFSQGIIRLNFGAALAYYTYDFQGQLNQTAIRQWQWEPSARLTFEFSRSHNLSLSYNRSNTYPGWMQLNEAFSIASYRNINTGNNNLLSAPNHVTTLFYRYMNLFSHYYLLANASYTRRVRAFGSNQITNFDTDIVSNTNVDFENFSRVWLTAGKDFYGSVPVGLKATIELNQLNSQNQFNEDINDYSNFTQSYNFQFLTRFKGFFNFDLGWRLIRKKFSSSLSAQETITNNERLSANLFFKIAKSFTLKPEFEQVFFSRDGQTQQEVFFGHLSAEYQANQQLTIKLKAFNLGNARQLNNADVNAFYTQITTRRILERYFLLSVNYQF